MHKVATGPVLNPFLATKPWYDKRTATTHVDLEMFRPPVAAIPLALDGSIWMLVKKKLLLEKTTTTSTQPTCNINIVCPRIVFILKGRYVPTKDANLCGGFATSEERLCVLRFVSSSDVGMILNDAVWFLRGFCK